MFINLQCHCINYTLTKGRVITNWDANNTDKGILDNHKKSVKMAGLPAEIIIKDLLRMMKC
jgi:hypothetical protein